MRFATLLMVAASGLGAGKQAAEFRTSVPQVYLIDYAADHVDNPKYVETVAASPPDILHVGHDVVFKSHLGPCRGSDPFPAVYERLSPDECWAETVRLRQYVQSLHRAGVRTVIPYICDVLIVGDHERRTGFWEFYDHWDEYKHFGFGERPASDPITWMQSSERRSVGKGDWYVYEPCINHPDWQRYLRGVVRSVARCGYDGAFVDINSFRCRNECCRKLFAEYLGERYSPAQIRELLGFDAPESVRLAADGDRTLLGVETCRFRALSMARLFTMLRREAPGLLILPNLSPMAHIDGVWKRVGNGHDAGRWAQACPWLMFEEMQQSGLFGESTVSDCVLQYKLAFASGVRGGMLLYYAKDPDGVALAMAEAGAGGGGALIQPGYDSPQVRATYKDFWRESRELFDGYRPWSDVGLCWFRDEAYWGNIDHLRAVYRTASRLSEAHVLFDFVVEQNLNAETLRSHRVNIVPDIRHLSDTDVKLLSDYARQGGVLVVSGDSGRFSELGRERSALPFREWPASEHMAEDPPTLRVGKGYCVLLDDFSRWVPSRPFEIFDLTEDEASDFDTVMRRAREAEAPSASAGKLLASLASLAGRPLQVAEAAPETVRISAFVKKTSRMPALVAHVVNYNVPIRGVAKSGPAVPAGNVAVGLPLPEGWRVGSVRALEPGSTPQPLDFVQEGGRVRVVLPRLGVYTVLCIR